MPKIPPREPVGDVFDGVLLRHENTPLLSVTTVDGDGIEVIASGELTVRYAVRYLEKPHLAIVPGLLAVDYGDFFNGEAMLDFIYTKVNSYPRAEVFGYRNDGVDDMIVLKKLDLERSQQVLVYAAPDDSKPLAAPAALIAPAGVNMPERLAHAIPRYDTLDDWIHRERTG